MAFAMSGDDGSARMVELDRLIQEEEKRLADMKAGRLRCDCGRLISKPEATKCARCAKCEYLKKLRAIYAGRQASRMRAVDLYDEQIEA